jgi:hypothetical protein
LSEVKLSNCLWDNSKSQVKARNGTVFETRLELQRDKNRGKKKPLSCIFFEKVVWQKKNSSIIVQTSAKKFYSKKDLNENQALGKKSQVIASV